MEFFDAHPGFAGAAIMFPAPLLEVAKSLEGTKGTIEDAVKRFEAAGETLVQKKHYRRVEVKVHDDHSWIGVTVYEGKEYPCHSFKAICFCEEGQNPHVHKASRAKYDAAKKSMKGVEDVEVTEKEFVAAMIAEGVTEKEAKFQAFISKGLGGATKVGGRMLKVK